MTTTLTVRSLKFTILEALAGGSKLNKFNMLGRGSDRGDLERQLNVVFAAMDRALADRSFEELKDDGLIQATYDDLIDPGSWVRITPLGQSALQRRYLDEFDGALSQISANLVEMRDGTWSAVASGRPDALRQASHSARELIDQTLRLGAPEEAIRSMAGFVPDSTSKNGITRRHRLKYLVTHHRGAMSDSELRVAEEACDLVAATDDRLKAMAHAGQSPRVDDVRDSLLAAEIALRRLLIRTERPG